MACTIMAMPAHRPGYWWVNVAPLGEAPVWEEQVAPPPPDEKLFAYEPAAFLAKQRKRA